MQRPISVPMDPEPRAALRRLAEAERRDPRDQAAVMLTAELRRLGYLEAAPAPGGAAVPGGIVLGAATFGGFGCGAVPGLAPASGEGDM